MARAISVEAFVPHGRKRGWLNPKEWTPRELRHSFVSLLSSSGVTIEEIAHLVGDGSTSVTERVYRKELRPVITRGARAINDLFDSDAER